jgi:hypothetical protein
MASPSLVIRRVVVEGELSCDLQFERGLNIVRAIQTDDDPKSTNKCGKTSLVELIQHGLGRRQRSKAKFHFAPIMEQLDRLWLEIETNDQVFTVERSLQEITARVRVREGPYVPGIGNAPAELVSVEEMSALLLNALSIPIVSVKTAKGDLFPLSFPTLMRAFVLHQEDSFGAILDKVLPEQRRADIIGILSGITPLERFTLEDKLSKVQLEVQELEAYFHSVQDFLIENGVPTLIEAEAGVRRAEEALQAAREAQRDVQHEIRDATSSQSPRQSGRIDNLRHQLLSIQDGVAQIERSFVGLRQEEERLVEVLASLRVDRQKAQRLRASSTILSSIEFSICPRCLLEITAEMRQREQYVRCSLCNRPLRITSDTPPRALPKTADIDLQIQEAETILKDVRREGETLRAQLQQLHEKENEIGNTLNLESQAYVSPAVDRLLGQAHEVAQREADLARAQALLGQAKALAAIKERLDQLKQKQAELVDQLREARKPYKSRLNTLRQIYESVLTEVDFPNLRSCQINSQSLMPYINNSLYIHAGTALKGLATVSFHLALLELARREETFFPRLLIIDSPAVGDLNDENHDKLLRYLANLQSNVEQPSSELRGEGLDFQIILTTRRLIPELESYVREEISAPSRMLLRKRQ